MPSQKLRTTTELSSQIMTFHGNYVSYNRLLRPEKRKKIRLTACAELVAWYRSQLVWRRSIRKSRAVTISHRHDVDIAGSPSFDDRCCAFGLWPTFNEFVDFESRRIINIFLFISPINSVSLISSPASRLLSLDKCSRLLRPWWRNWHETFGGWNLATQLISFRLYLALLSL